MKKKTLVLGASLKPERYSNIAINRLRNYNHEVKAFGLRSGEVSGAENDKFYSLLKDHNIGYEVACTLVLLGTGQY